MKTTGIYTILLFTFILGQTDDDYYEVKLTMNPPEFGQFFGGQLSIDGELAAISGGFAVHYYRLLDGEWIKFQSMTSDDTPYELPIAEISLYDSTIAYCLGGGGFLPYEANRIYINQYDGEFWQRDTVITIDDLADTSLVQFGNNISLFENSILVMANTSETNRVYLFEKVNNSWEIITYFEKENSELFGFALTQTNDLICIGARGFENNYEDSGAVYCYQNIGFDWIELPIITSPDPGENYHFGSNIALHEEYLMIGENGNLFTGSFPGRVYIYRYDQGDMIYIQELNASDAEGGDQFGSHIAAYNNQLIIGAWKNDDAGTVSGSAYIYDQVENDIGVISWVETKKIISSDLAINDHFGEGVGIMDDFVMITASNKDNFSGAVYVYDPHDTTLHANFAGDVRNGNAPVTVQFTSVPQGNPTAYEWDFNSDGFIDSTEPNPQFTYQINGVYNVTLTVFDETGSDTDIKEDYIQVVSDILFGDVNGDGILDVSDLVIYIDFVLGYSEPEEEQFLAGDVNYSGQIDIIDIVMVIDEILG